MTRAVFLDRDGVINRYREEFVRTRGDFEYCSDCAAAFSLLGTLGLPIVIVTNQSGIGRGYTTAAEVEAIHRRLRDDVRGWGASIASIEVCPHRPGEGCSCRKPATGLFERAAERLGLELPGSYMVGDAPADIEVGRRLGMVTLRVTAGRGREPLAPGQLPPHHAVAGLLAAARRIAELEGSAP